MKHRLQQLGLPKAAIYAIACVTHSRDVVLACKPHPIHPAFIKMSKLLDDFWHGYPNSLNGAKAQPRKRLICCSTKNSAFLVFWLKTC